MKHFIFSFLFVIDASWSEFVPRVSTRKECGTKIEHKLINKGGGEEEVKEIGTW